MLIDVIVEQSRNHVMRTRYGVKIARKVKVYLLHRKNLCITATRSAALHSEARTERRLAQCHDCFLANLV